MRVGKDWKKIDRNDTTELLLVYRSKHFPLMNMCRLEA